MTAPPLLAALIRQSSSRGKAMRTRPPSGSWRMRRAASTPSRRGMPRSMKSLRVLSGRGDSN